jgi:N-acylneuraminate cytidylyltransferase/CMP-N,N'-diacetyllegionaminic acid synthase
MKKNTKNIIAAICARGGSKGVPRKNIRMLYGKPLIAHSISCAKKCHDIKRIIVSTDDQEIADTAQKFGAEVPFIRPKHLAQDNSAKWEVFQHLVWTIEKNEGSHIDVLVDLDTGVPLRKPEDISGCLNLLFSNDDIEVVTTAYEAERNPYFNMVEIDKSGFAKIVVKPEKPIACRQDAPKVFSLSPAVFAIKRDILWKYDHWSQSKFKIFELDRLRAIDIDHEIDFNFIEFLLTQGNNHE